MEVRELVKEDYCKGFMTVINHFTRNKIAVTYDDFSVIFDSLSKEEKILVIETDGQVVATGKILLERKLHNNFSMVGHIEDIVVREDYRNRGYGSIIINKLIELGKTKNCYKIVLNVNEDYKKFYKVLGFKEKGIEMCMYTSQ